MLELEKPKGPKGHFRHRGNQMVCLHPPQQNRPLFPLHEPLHWKAKRDPKAKMLSLQSFLRKGVSLGYVGSI